MMLKGGRLAWLLRPLVSSHHGHPWTSRHLPAGLQNNIIVLAKHKRGVGGVGGRMDSDQGWTRIHILVLDARYWDRGFTHQFVFIVFIIKRFILYLFYRKRN